MGFLSPTKPYERDYLGEGYTGFLGQQALAAPVAEAERQWRPYWAETGNTELQASLFGYGGPGAMTLGRRAGNQTLKQLQQWSPTQYGLLGTLGQQAASELEDPYRLSSAEVRNLTNYSRAPGLSGFGRQPLEAYLAYSALGSAGEQRAAQRRAFAGEVMNAENQYLAMPALQTRNAIIGAGLGRTTGPTLFNPWNAYLSDVENTNLNAEASAKMAGYNTRMQLLSSLMGTSGGAGGAAMGGGGGGGY